MSRADDLNSEVSDAIMKAEQATRNCAYWWGEVARLENELSRHTDTPDSEKKIACRGDGCARVKAMIARSLNNDR
jgi:hypothetical protein